MLHCRDTATEHNGGEDRLTEKHYLMEFEFLYSWDSHGSKGRDEVKFYVREREHGPERVVLAKTVQLPESAGNEQVARSHPVCATACLCKALVVFAMVEFKRSGRFVGDYSHASHGRSLNCWSFLY